VSEENVMKRGVAVWIDHREAVIAAISGEVEATSRLESNIEKHVRFSSGEGGAEDQRDKRYANHLREYYDAVVSRIGDADAILLLGPGEAKHELEKRLRDEGFGTHIVGVETVDKMTDHQIAARARQRLPK
jgi:stalled ribosome rescue protein Dom34